MSSSYIISGCLLPCLAEPRYPRWVTICLAVAQSRVIGAASAPLSAPLCAAPALYFTLLQRDRGQPAYFLHNARGNEFLSADDLRASLEIFFKTASELSYAAQPSAAHLQRGRGRERVGAREGEGREEVGMMGWQG